METEGTRTRIIATTVELMEAQGYHATGLNQILHLSATPKGSLYHHFSGGKEELAAEAVSAAGQAFTHELDAIIVEGTDLGMALSLLISFFRERLQTSNFQKGCPLATVTLEMAATSDLIQHASRAGYHAWLTRLEHLLIASGCEPARAPARALFALSAIEGALLLCQAERSTHPLEQVVEELRLLFEGDTKAR
ncbi:TetR/AcrR family transcriptional regulator [Dictyobacter arantiisoli]|uniref:TetR family transcriptional regulator n=1 Tax=Dictyobacter arantiisoli TaxID=2014874 RepID=A0A5A5TDN7_9CHLR|nr:TetR/AcrR family transcriptional regulator [Dictyobacter arantiisoli]GCF09325.1 TetR family transcriptional regulator [Dictyobacter arantiisoli]